MAIHAHYEIDSKQGSGKQTKGTNNTSDTNDTWLVNAKLWSLFNKQLFKANAV